MAIRPRIIAFVTIGITSLSTLALVATAQQEPAKPQEATSVETKTDESPKPKTLKQATFGGGCFWCTEAVFEQLRGVEDAVSGYAGGRTANPTYKQVLTGLTGHAEVTQVTYDPDVISYAELLEVFWKTHDPTTLNRQGPDIGTQYRSIILYHDEEQKALATAYKQKLNAARAFGSPIVTEIKPFRRFYPAEAYHQDYFRNNPYQGYCQYVIVPKMEKFRQVFREKLKP